MSAKHHNFYVLVKSTAHYILPRIKNAVGIRKQITSFVFYYVSSMLATLLKSMYASLHKSLVLITCFLVH
jgi:hypothetical protein